MNVLALDLATTTGWALRAYGRLSHGVFKLPNGHRERVVALEDELATLLHQVAHGRGDVVFETSCDRFHNATLVAGQLQGVLHAQLEAFGVPVDRVFGYTPKAAKKFATGNGNATKGDVIASVRERWAEDVEDDNAADALALLHLHESEVASE